jgi:DnaJ like chaperone protein
MTSSSLNIPRHWWGKIIGAVIGLFRGGLTGAVIGALFGHMVDRFISGMTGAGSTQKAFFNALFSTLGHLSKADGRVTQVEISMVESLMQRMDISGENRQRAIRCFNQGKQTGFDLHAALRPFVQHSLVRQDLRRMFMEILVESAFTSGRVSEAEQAILVTVARELRIPGHLFAAMLQARQAGPGSYRSGAHGGAGPGAGGGRTAAAVGPLEQAYAKLGLKIKASDHEVKKAYRKLISQYHPDKLVSRGLPEEMMEMAKTRVRDINTAYDQIKQARGFK